MVASVRSQVPTRLPGGATTDAPFQPLADSGYGNPAFYHQFWDDFDNSLGATGLYTVSGSGETLSHLAGDGGILQISLAATSGDYGSIQLPAASFQLPQGTTYPTGTVGKKLFYGARLTGISSLSSLFILGLCDTTSTIFTTITDGVYFYWNGSALNLLTVASSTTQTWTIPTSAYSMAVNTQLDLAYYIDWYGNINVFVAPQLFGFMPQSGSGAASAVTGVTTLPTVGPVLTVVSQNYLTLQGLQAANSPMVGPWTESSANLNVTAGFKSSAASAMTMQLDFHLAQKER